MWHKVSQSGERNNNQCILFTYNHLVSFRRNKNIRDNLVRSALRQKNGSKLVIVIIPRVSIIFYPIATVVVRNGKFFMTI